MFTVRVTGPGIDISFAVTSIEDFELIAKLEERMRAALTPAEKQTPSQETAPALEDQFTNACAKDGTGCDI